MAILGLGQGTSYPASIDTSQTWTNVPGIAPDSSSRMDAELVNDFANAILALEATLGIQPASVFGTVAARLEAYLPPGGTIPTGRVLLSDALGRMSGTANLQYDTVTSRLGVNTSAPQAPLDVRNLGSAGTFNANIQVADAGSAIVGRIGIRHLSADTRQGLKISSGVTLTLHAGTGNVELHTGTVVSEASDTTARLRVWNDGSVTIGTPAGGTGGPGTLNAHAVFANGVVLTSYPLAYVRTGPLDLEYWDSKAPGGHHGPARAFAARAEATLALPQYIAAWQASGHLPGLPNPQDFTVGDRISIDDLLQRLWETVDVFAVHIAQLHDRVVALEEELYGPQ